jgi:acyl-coenzyme A synthetase/AMP-(fatty) acid ligase
MTLTRSILIHIFPFTRALARIWRHGDYVLIHSDTGGITFYGRSDAVLKPSGIRIGTSEIYNVIEKIPEIARIALQSHKIGRRPTHHPICSAFTKQNSNGGTEEQNQAIT